jgi:hypothetical protein
MNSYAALDSEFCIRGPKGQDCNEIVMMKESEPVKSNMILMIWLYVSGLAYLIGVEINAEIEHAGTSAVIKT